MTIAQNFPAVEPNLLLDFANTRRLDPRITFVRTTTATYYDGTTTAKAEENLLLQSQDFTTSWTNTGTTDTANTSSAPDGTTTADTVTENTTTGLHNVYSAFISINGLSYVFSVFFKKGNGIGARNFVQIGLQNAAFGTNSYANFDIVNGTVTTTGAGLTSASIVSVGNSWWRCVIIDTAVASTSTVAVISLITTGTSVNQESYTGTTDANIFLWGAQLEQRSSVTAYTATTTQPITNYIPVLQTAASGVARFDHNPTTDESLGLLIEEARTNLWTYSADFANASWTKSNASVSSNTIVAPDGALTGDQLVENTSTGQHRVYRSVSGTTNTNPYTCSFFAKASTRTRIYVGVVEGASFVRQGNAVFDLSAGTVASVSTGVSGATGGAATIQNVGNGWYRCTYTVTLGGTNTSIFCDINLVNTGTTISYTGDGYSGIYIWGAQLEAGAFATSYIPTVASTVTRNADSATMTETNFTSWFNGIEGTVYSELSSLSSLTGVQSVALNRYPIPWQIRAGTTDTRIFWYGTVAELYIGGTYNNLSTVPTGLNKIAVTFSSTAGQAASSLNGAAAVSRSGALVGGTATRFDIGCDSTNLVTTVLNGTIRKLAYYPVRISNTNLQALTS